MSIDLDCLAARLAERQHGVFSREQLRAAGASPRQLATRLRRGRWSTVRPGIYRLAGIRDGWRAQLWEAHLHLGAASIVSHEAAALLHGFGCLADGAVTLTIPNGGHQRVGGWVVHQSRDLPLDERWIDRSVVDGLPITTPARTVLDLAAVVREGRLASIVDSARNDRLLTIEEAAAGLQAFARRGKPGVRRLARVLDDLGPGKEVTASVLERRLLRLLRDHGLPRPCLQPPHPGRSLPSSCTDAAYVEAMLILEADGRRWHSRLGDLKRDRERDAEAARAGWQTLRVLHEHVVGDPAGTAAVISETYEVRRRQLRAA